MSDLAALVQAVQPFGKAITGLCATSWDTRDLPMFLRPLLPKTGRRTAEVVPIIDLLVEANRRLKDPSERDQAAWILDGMLQRNGVNLPPPGPPRRLHPYTTARVLNAWTAAHPDAMAALRLQQDQAKLLFPDLAFSGWLYATVHELFRHAPHPEGALTLLREATARRAAMEVEAQEARAHRDRPPEDPQKRAVWQSVRTLVLPKDAWPAAPRRLKATFDADTATLTVRAGAAEPIGAVRLSPFTTTGFGGPLARLAWGEVMDALTDPKHALHDPVAQFLRLPLWRHSLDQLTRRPPARPSSQEPVLWRFDAPARGIKVSPATMPASKRGAPPIVKLDDIHEAQLTDPADLRVHAHLASIQVHTNSSAIATLLLLVGHPRVYFGKVPVAVQRHPLTIEVTETLDDGLQIALSAAGQPITPQALLAAFELGHFHGHLLIASEDGLLLIGCPPSARDLVRRLTLIEPRFPAEARPEIAAWLDGLSPHLPTRLPASLSGEPVVGDLRQVVRLALDERALEVRLSVRPLPECLPHAPGEGPEEIRALRDGRRVVVRRDLARERLDADTFVARARLGALEPEAPGVWRIPFTRAADRDLALGVIEALDADPSRYIVEWSGPSLRVAPQVRKIRVQVGGGRDWFALSGEGEGVSLDALLEAAAEGAQWVQLRDGAWGRLAETLQDPLAALARAGHEKGQRGIHALHAPLVRGLIESGVEVEVAPTFRAHLARLREATDLAIDVPAQLNAELRTYQVDGFRWLARLAHWAPGALLADDMGLGKTVQTIALLLRRAVDGPALVVAPTSVVFNWQREIARFAPALSVHTYGTSDRQALINAIGPGDVVLISYGLVQRDAEHLEKRSFGTLVLDEAQAIKNPDAQRSRSVHQLNAAFRVALTGTPVENHATDLWSVFRAVAPGLLGSLESFRRRDDSTSTSRRALASTVRPFILRRRKREVAPELPPRTEAIVEVALSGDERALYERARLAAMARAAQGDAGPQARFQVLAALMRLRQLASHPRLADPHSAVPSSKLAVLRRMLGDLREEGHKALVFSQFVEHLNLIEAALNEDGLKTRRIDGSTPADARRREVDAFQGGEGDVFLVSLKAGGVGLNLTAATFVFHVEPWWNPAAEDQATDRAHRIGQTQPVTVYRLVARGTIEQSILGLHDEKRNLANDLLDGTDIPRTIPVEELLQLLAGAPDVDDAPVEPTPAVSPAEIPAATPPVATATRFDALAARFAEQLNAWDAAGNGLRPASRRVYEGIVRRFLAWAEVEHRGPEAELPASFAVFLASPAATATDRTSGRAGLNHLAALCGPDASTP